MNKSEAEHQVVLAAVLSQCVSASVCAQLTRQERPLGHEALSQTYRQGHHGVRLAVKPVESMGVDPCRCGVSTSARVSLARVGLGDLIADRAVHRPPTMRCARRYWLSGRCTCDMATIAKTLSAHGGSRIKPASGCWHWSSNRTYGRIMGRGRRTRTSWSWFWPPCSAVPSPA